MQKILIIFIILFLVFPIASFAAGQGGLEFDTLKTGVGARALGMGSAYTAVSDNADSPFWNPAGLAKINYNSITTSQTRMSTDADHYYLSYVCPFGKGALGLSWIQIGSGTLTRTSTTDSYNEVITLGTFSSFSNAYLLSYGIELTSKISAGLTAKYLSKDLDQTASGEAHGYSIAPGVIVRPNERLALGMKVDELFNEVKWGTGTTEKVPPRVHFGVAIRPQLARLAGLFSFDFTQLLKQGYSGSISAGYEWENEGLSLRAGYSESALTAGAGFESGAARLDYAYVQQNQLSRENVHRISLSGKW